MQRADASWDLAAVTRAFAAAAVDPSLWNQAMEAASAAAGSVGAVLLPVQGRLPVFPVTPSMAEPADVYVREGWIHRDLRYRGLRALLDRGTSTELDIIDPDNMKRHPYYQEFLRPLGLKWHGNVKIAALGSVWSLSLQRTIQQGPFLLHEVERLAELSKNLAAAAALAEAFGFARAEAALDAFELSGKAVALLNAKGEVFRVNRAAQAMLGQGLRIVRGRIASDSVDATAALDRALHALLWSPHDLAFARPILLPRAMGRPILAYPSRSAGVAKDIFSSCQMIVVLVDLAAPLSIVERELRQTFGLTTIEARLANQLLGETSLEEAADALNVTYETARGTLKSVLRKTDTNRQGQLVALLAKIAFRAKIEHDPRA